MKIKDNLTISELSRIAGIPATTIQFYRREGLITAPVKRGKTRAYYNEEHILQLERIKQLREENKLSIKEIKKTSEFLNIIKANNNSEETPSIDRKNSIIETVIDLFRNKAYDSISINDIVEKANISKATFYKHFYSKENLFYECADRVFYNIDKDLKDLLKEKNIVERLILRATVFVRKHHHMIDMLHILRGASPGDDSKNKIKLNRIMENLTMPIARDLEEGVEQGFFRDIDTTIVSHLLIGAVEYGIYFCEGKSPEEIEKNIEDGLSMILQGFKHNSL